MNPRRPSAAIALDGESKSAFRIIPAGEFSPVDGRPMAAPWKLTEARGRALVAEAARRSIDYLIDYEHQSLNVETNGQPAPAAGWFKTLEWRADGLYVTDARWTAEARRMIQAKEYRFISPVFTFDDATYEVGSLISIALTNNPALHGLTDLALVAVNSGRPAGGAPVPASTMTTRDRETLAAAFGATPEELAERSKNQQEPPHQEGMTAEEWQKFNHVFGGSLASKPASQRRG